MSKVNFEIMIKIGNINIRHKATKLSIDILNGDYRINAFPSTSIFIKELKKYPFSVHHRSKGYYNAVRIIELLKDMFQNIKCLWKKENNRDKSPYGTGQFLDNTRDYECCII